MKKFKVKASYVMYVDTIIEAHDLDEAKDIAYEMDGVTLCTRAKATGTLTQLQRRNKHGIHIGRRKQYRV